MKSPGAEDDVELKDDCVKTIEYALHNYPVVYKRGYSRRTLSTALWLLKNIQDNMKIFILLGLVVASQAAAVVYHPAWWPSASAYQTKDIIGNYAFGHTDANPGGPSFHSEAGDASGKKVGSYGVKHPDGKVRVVEYVADADGFKANIKTSEKLDKDHKDPANVKVTEAEHVAPVAPVVYAHPFAYYAYPYYVKV